MVGEGLVVGGELVVVGGRLEMLLGRQCCSVESCKRRIPALWFNNVEASIGSRRVKRRSLIRPSMWVDVIG